MVFGMKSLTFLKTIEKYLSSLFLISIIRMDA
jgi:hypothetical protein